MESNLRNNAAHQFDDASFYANLILSTIPQQSGTQTPHLKNADYTNAYLNRPSKPVYLKALQS